jgi:WD40 repeat protein/actin-like ATPase involved in cell morphogenesis
VTSAPHTSTPRDVVLVVDFGTVFSEATLLLAGAKLDLADPLAGDRRWPSCVYAGRHGVAVGELARRMRKDEPKQVIAEFKRKLGDTETFGDRELAAWELTAELLQAVRAEAQKIVTPVDRLLITCPGDYLIHTPEDRRWSDLDRACRKAGFTDIEYLHEPVAAAYAPVAEGPLAPDTVVLVYDFGGGTFDAALAQIGESEHDILAAESMPYCGGADIDALLIEEIREITGTGADPGHGIVDAWLKNEAQEAKEQLSKKDEHPVRISPLAEKNLVTRERLERLVKDRGLVDQTLTLVTKLIDDATPVEPDVILAAGGTTRMPLVRQRLAEEFDYPVRQPVDIGCAVIEGAVAWSRLAAERTTGPELFTLDQIPLRWSIPGGMATVSSWLAEANDRLEADDPIVRVALPDGRLWDLRSSRRGILHAQHYQKDQEVRSGDWLATMQPAEPGETDAIQPRLWRQLPGGALTLAALSPDGRYAATATDGSVTVYDLVGWAELRTFPVSQPQQLVFIPGGKFAVVAGKGFRIWDLATLETTGWTEDGRNQPRIAPSPDGRLLAVSALDDRQVRFLSADDGTVQQTIDLDYGGGSYCYDGGYSPDGSLLVPASQPATGIRRADWDEGLEIVPGRSVLALAIRPGDNQIISSAGDTRIFIVNKENFELQPGSDVPTAHNIRSLAFSRSGKLLACGQEGGRVEIRRSASAQVSGPVATFWTGSDCFFTAFTPDGTGVVAGNKLGLGIWSLGDAIAPSPAGQSGPS